MEISQSVIYKAPQIEDLMVVERNTKTYLKSGHQGELTVVPKNAT